LSEIIVKSPTKVIWTIEKIKELKTNALERLLENARRMGAEDVVSLCEEELAHRKPKKSGAQTTRTPSKSNRGRTVIGFHFVCDREKGVTSNPDGTFWSGTWVVDVAHAERAPEVGAYLALHDNKKSASYKQGRIIEWRKTDREPDYAGRPVKIETGIEFRVRPTNRPYEWVGGGAGEKGYAWSDGPVSNSLDGAQRCLRT
jgi:hypothetical protein